MNNFYLLRYDGKEDALRMVSIIIPVYKIQESLLRRSLNSIMIQGSSDIECIVVDDGSPDSCGEICDQYAMLDKRIKVIHTENAGVSNARNIGMQNSSGIYTLFMDGDDFFPSGDCVEKLCAYMDNASCDILFFKYIHVNGMTKITDLPGGSGKIWDVNLDDIIFKVISGQDTSLPYMYGSPWGKVFRTDFIKRNNLQFPLGIKKSQDRIFMTRLLSFHPRVKAVDDYGYAYVRDSTSICHQYNSDIVKILTDAADELNKSINDYYPKEFQMKLHEAFCYFKFSCLYNFCQLYFFASNHTATKADRALFIEICKEYRPYIKECRTNKGLSIERRILLVLIKCRLFHFAYFVEKEVNSLRNSNFIRRFRH